MASAKVHDKLSFMLFQDVIKNITKSTLHELNLSGPEFCLRSINGLDELVADHPHLRAEVEVVHLDHNELQSLHLLQVFSKLKSIFASHNQIQYLCSSPTNQTLNKWPVSFPSLNTLDLSYNSLKSIPDLNSMPNLHELRLNSNQLTSFDGLENGRNLTVLDLSTNAIRVSDEVDFEEKTFCFRKLTNLKVVNLVDNQLVRMVPKYYLFIAKQIRQGSKYSAIAMIDSYKIDKDVKALADSVNFTSNRMAHGDASAQDRSGFGSSTIQASDLQDGESVFFLESSEPSSLDGIPTIHELNDVIEACFSNPEDCIKYVKMLSEKVRQIVDMPSKYNQLFEPLPREATVSNLAREGYVEAVIDDFLQNIALLSQRHPQLLRSLLRLLAHLSVVDYDGVGTRCLRQLEDFMAAGEVVSNEVIGVINSHLVPMIKRTSRAKLRKLLILNLTELAEKSHSPRVLRLLIPLMNKWMRRGSADLGPTDAILRLVAVASADTENARQMGDFRFHQYVVDEFNRCPKFKLRYEHLLTIFKNLCLYDSFPLDAPTGGTSASGDGSTEEAEHQGVSVAAVRRNPGIIAQPSQRNVSPVDDMDDDDLPDNRAEGLFNRNVHSRSANEFAKDKIVVKLNEDLRDLVSGHVEAQEHRYSLVQLCVSALAAVCRAEEGFLILMNPNNKANYLRTLYQLYSNPRQPPGVLTSVFRGFLEILTTPVSWYPLNYESINSTLEVHRFTVIEDITKHLQNVVPLLQYLGESGSRYVDCCLNSKMTPGGNQDMGGVAPKVAQQRNPIIHALLVSVIDLITFYCHEGNASTEPLARGIVYDLNKAERERFLFASLDCPSDAVRLAVVRCLLQVPLSQLDSREVNHLVTMLKNERNISSGHTEEVLSGSLKLITKLCLSSTGEPFRATNALHAAEAAMSILERNEARDTKGQVSETKQKILLSKSCVNYLKACSVFPELQTDLRSHSVVTSITKVLRLEDHQSQHSRLHPSKSTDESREDHYPVHIEQTWPGRQVEYLMQTLVGENRLSPHGPVVPRVLRRMADVLMGVPDPSWEDIAKYWLPDVSGNDDDGHDAPFGADSAPASLAALDQQSNAPESTQSQLFNAVQHDGNSLPNAQEQDDVTTGRSQRPKPVQALIDLVADPTLDSRVASQLEVEREQRMPFYWDVDHIHGTTHVKFESSAARLERLQQHNVFEYYQGLERLLLFLANFVETSAKLSPGFGGAKLATKNETGDGRNVIQVNENVIARLLDGFVVPNVVEEVRRTMNKVEKSEAVNSRPSPSSLPPEGGILSKNSGVSKSTSDSNSNNNPATTGGDTAADESETSVQYGREVLLRTFMQSGKRDVAMANSSPISSLGGVDAVLLSPETMSATDGRDREPEVAEVLTASLRVIFALLHYGVDETKRSFVDVLRKPQKLKLLACICLGSTTEPFWHHSSIGAKLMTLCYAVCDNPRVRRSEPLEMLNTFAIVTKAASRILCTLDARLQAFGELPQDDFITAYCTIRTVTLLASQLSFVGLPHTTSDAAHEEGFNRMWDLLLPHHMILKPILRLLLHNMKIGRDQGFVVENRHRWVFAGCTDDKFFIHDETREEIANFLVICLCKSRTDRYEVLEHITRAELMDQYPIRASFVQELLSKVAQLGYKEMVEEILVEREHKEVALKAMGAADRTQVNAGAKKESGSFFSMCFGARNYHTPQSTHTSTPSTWLVEPPPPSLQFETVDTSTTSSSGGMERFFWRLDRVGDERVVQQLWVDVFTGRSSQRQLFVLSSEACYMFSAVKGASSWFSGEQEDNYNAKPTLLWRRPYRAVEKIVWEGAGTCFHVDIRSSDVVEHRAVNQYTIVPYVHGKARELVQNLSRLCREWSVIELSLGASKSIVRVPPLTLNSSLLAGIRKTVESMKGKEGTSGGKNHPVSDSDALLVSHVLASKTQSRAGSQQLAILSNRVFATVKVDWSKLVASMNGEKISKLVSTGSDTISEHLADLREIMLEGKDVPKVVLGFGAPAAQKTGDPTTSKRYYYISFHDDYTRETWRRRILQQTINMEKV